LNIDIEAFKRFLLQKGFEKVYVVEKTYDCVLLLGKVSEVEVLIAVYSGTHSLYAKTVISSDVLEPYWRCSYVEYVPHGLYAFSHSRSIEELAEKVALKVQTLLKRQRSKE